MNIENKTDKFSDIIEKIMTINKNININYILKNCIEHCDINIIKFLVECGCPLDYDEYKIAIIRNDMEIIKYIYDKTNFAHYDCAEFLTISIKNKNLDLIKFLIEDLGLEETCLTNILEAIMTGDREIITYVYKKSNPTEKSIIHMKSIGMDL
jgi:hypothetical protein